MYLLIHFHTINTTTDPVTHRKKSMCKGKDASTSDKIDISYKGEPVSDVHRRIFVSTQPSSNVALFESL